MSGHGQSTGAAGPQKPGPKEALSMLSEGNQRFALDRSRYPRSGVLRRQQAHVGDQGDHAIATILSCSDSRVPVELIFDQGIMDLFVVRTAGQAVDDAALASLEYGMLHVHTPLLVVLGHSGCGAVTATLNMVANGAKPAEPSLVNLLEGIAPAVRSAMEQNAGAGKEKLLDMAIEENVRQIIQSLFQRSPDIKRGVAEGSFDVVGAIYDLGDGRVRWMEPLTAA